ncbi:uncharacterized protein VTP21DRAFT_5690 [Calcarisporiella thermophila]|uniref:uncharacterized protein n=1 Tax=Calcarisporiella thermophila TaxID=911321 RepID=UPI00374218E0
MVSPLIIAARRVAPTIRASGMRYSSSTSAANFAAERDGIKKHAGEAASLWRKISIFVCVPALTLAGINAYNLAMEHAEHMKHHEDEEKVIYPHMKIRSKQFFWGDGDTSLFHNPKVNFT